MKKTLTIVGIVFAALASITLIAISVVIWIVFTPERLTPMVRNMAKEYITCPHQIGEVELTFFSTFPQFGLAINNFHLVNPTEGAPSDTLLTASKVVAKVDIQAFLKRNSIIVDGIELENMSATIFVDSLGKTNYDVFALDTTAVEKEDSEFSLAFDAIALNHVKLHMASIVYVDKQSNVEAEVYNLTSSIACQLNDNKGDGLLTLSMPSVTCMVGNEYYLNKAALQLKLPFYTDLGKFSLNLKESETSLNGFNVLLSGTVQMADKNDINTNLSFALAPCEIESLLTLLPASMAKMLDKTQLGGKLAVSGTVIGTYNETTMPLVDVNINVAAGKAEYAELPYKLHDLEAKVSAHLNLNDSLASYVVIDQLEAKTGKSSFAVSGDVKQLMGDMLCNLTISTNLNLSELAPMLPNDLNVKMKGNTKGDVQLAFAMSQLDAMAFEKMVISGNLNYADLDVVYEDSMQVKSNKGTLSFTIPNSKSTHKDTRFLRANITSDDLQMQQGKTTTANLSNTKLGVEISNVVADNRYISANCTFDIGTLNATMDSIAGYFSQPKGSAYMQLDVIDTTAVPTLQMDIAMQQLKGSMDTLSVDIKEPKAKVSLTGSRRNKEEPRLRIDYSNTELMAQMGSWVKAKVGKTALVANARQNSKEKDLLLQWNPRLDVDLQDGDIMVTDLPEIVIPEIAFNFNMHDFDIRKSLIKLGNSDFSLVGKAENIDGWLRNEGLLKGEFNFTSEFTDVNELMKLTSGFGETADSTVVAEAVTEAVTEAQPEDADPFMVPRGVDVKIFTNIKKAIVGEQTATNLGGNLYVQDGVLTLEEIGFICHAAKMQLSATYKTPRTNHLYLGFIYHMVDVHIEELASLFPEVINMVPMLSSFKGQGEFHIAAETYTDAYYKPKVSTLRGACSIQGKDLVLMDSETFTDISKMFLFKKKTENKIDTLYAEMALFKDKIDVYPLLITIDKYQAALGGSHYLNMNFNYHISLLKPLRIGVDVGGDMENLKLKLTKCKYAEDFRPKKENAVETQNQRLRKIIRESLNRTMTIKSEQE